MGSVHRWWDVINYGWWKKCLAWHGLEWVREISHTAANVSRLLDCQLTLLTLHKVGEMWVHNILRQKYITYQHTQLSYITMREIFDETKRLDVDILWTLWLDGMMQCYSGERRNVEIVGWKFMPRPIRGRAPRCSSVTRVLGGDLEGRWNTKWFYHNFHLITLLVSHQPC